MISIAFTGGGTGGHIYPGLAVAESLQEKIPCRILWIGSDLGMDRSIVEKAGIDFFGIPSGKLRRYFSFKNLSDLFRILAGFFAARSILKKQRPALLFSKGGFVSVPPCMAAASLGIPVFTHESDFSPGLATRLNLRWAEKVLLAYEETALKLKIEQKEKCLVVGNPLRSAFNKTDEKKGRQILGLSAKERILLVLGGSQGAKQVNELILENLTELCARYVVVHQTGLGFAAPGKAPPGYFPLAYINEELPDILAASELIVGRSGAGTVWEAASQGKPMVLIPLSGSGTRGDQVENAEYFRKKGAALVLDASSNLLSLILKIADNEELRNKMGAASKSIAQHSGAELCANLIIERLQGEEE
ncbi:undecaprenyldiphospho-muramoylpentapeptide beta-N-acetylglucosaminyltransferase [Treponema sp.]